MTPVIADREVLSYQMYIDGSWVDASGGATYQVVDPATEEPIATVAKGTVANAERAVKAAREAFDHGPWPHLSALERSNSSAPSPTACVCAPRSLPSWRPTPWASSTESRVDMNDVAHTFDYYAGLAVDEHGQTLEVPGESLSIVVREPVGVTVGITPWNYPLLLAAWKIAPALAAGNVMILKPATVSPTTSLELARICEEAGLPRGVFQVVTGGGDVGEYLAGSPLVDMVAFTGSLKVGRRIMSLAAANVKKVGLELGGKSPNIIFEDADFQAAIDGALTGIFAGSGEVCSAGSRLLVQRSIYDRFVGELVSRVMAIKVGPGDDESSEMAPLVSRNQLETVEKYVRIGRDEGATLATGGHRLGERGFYFEPTVFINVDNGMRIAQEEIFGPVLAVIPFDTEEEAISIANDTIYGLAGAVWTKTSPAPCTSSRLCAPASRG